jgi:hypothetical protein
MFSNGTQVGYRGGTRVPSRATGPLVSLTHRWHSTGQRSDASRCCIAKRANSRRFVTPTFSNMLVR